MLIVGAISISRSALNYGFFAVWKPRLRSPNVAALTQVCNLILTITCFVYFVVKLFCVFRVFCGKSLPPKLPPQPFRNSQGSQAVLLQ